MKKLISLLFIIFLSFNLYANPIKIYYLETLTDFGTTIVQKIYVYEQHGFIWKVRYEEFNYNSYIDVRNYNIYDKNGNEIKEVICTVFNH